MNGFLAIADAIDRIAGARFDRMTDADRLEVDDVLEAATAWARRELPIHEFAKVGTIPSPATGRTSSGYTRYVAMLATPITDPRRMDLRRAIDALLRFQGIEVTTHGVFDRDEIVDVPILSRIREHERRAA